MIPRYRALGAMAQQPNGTYVAATDYEHLRSELEELGRQVIDYFKAAECGEITAQEAIAAAAALARLKGLQGST